MLDELLEHMGCRAVGPEEQVMDGSQPVFAERPLVSQQAAAAPKRSRKRLLLAAVAVAVLTGAGLYGRDWWLNGRFIELTDDAYVQSDMVAVSSRVAGQIAEVLVADNQRVRRGDVLARLDDRDLQAALAQARADVASAEADINALQAQLGLQASTVAAADADVASADAAVGFARAENARYADLMRTGNGSVQRAQQAESDIRVREAAAAHARAAAEGARQQVTVLRAQLGRAQASLLRAQASARQAELNVSYAVITAPTDGAIGDRTVRAGPVCAAGDKAAEPGADGCLALRGRQLQGDAARAYGRGRAGDARRRHAGRQRAARHGGELGAGQRLDLCAAAAGECNRQLHQDRAACAGADPAAGG